MSIRVAIIGAGIMGADHARIVAEDLPGAVLHLISDASEDRARAIADAYGAADISTDPAAAIRRDDVDAVVIAAPDETHTPLSLIAIKSGKPVLCEKPLSQDPAECRAVIQAEMSHGRRFVQLGFMRRFDPSYREMKVVLDDGSLGRAVMMHNFHRNMEAPANFTGQMAITNSAPHEFDVARYVLGADYQFISAFQPAGVDASKIGAPVFMVLETDKGQLVNIEINNNAAYGYDVRGELVGEKGSAFLSNPIHTRLNVALKAYERYPPDWRPRFAEAYRLQNRAFLKFVQTGIFPTIASDAWDGLAAAEVAQAGVLALRTQRRVEVPQHIKPVLYQR